MPALKAVLIIFLFALFTEGQAQTQLVVLNRENVLARYSEGQPFSYKRKKSKAFELGYIVQINEFSVITTYDTVEFSEIEKIAIKRPFHATKLIGSALFYTGFLYFTIDEANSILVHDQGYDNDKAVWQPAAILVGVGLILKSLRRGSIRIRYPAKLLAAPRGSSFWRPQY